MTDFNRRAFLGVAGLAAGAGVFGLDTGVLGMWAEQQPPGFPDEILNPIEVSGEEAVPIIGRLPGARRMYVLPANVGEHHLVGSQVMTRIARPVETGNVHELDDLCRPNRFDHAAARPLEQPCGAPRLERRSRDRAQRPAVAHDAR